MRHCGTRNRRDLAVRSLVRMPETIGVAATAFTVPGFLASRRYRAAKSRPKSARQLRDELLIPEIRRLHEENYGVDGVRKMHPSLRREG